MIRKALFSAVPRRSTPIFQMRHIKNMIEYNARVIAQYMNDKPLIEESGRVYKPSKTIEFNRYGYVLLYSGNPIKNSTIYFKYPYILYESLIPLAILNYLYNPLDLWYYINSWAMWGSFFLVTPRMWYLSDLKYMINKMFLLRGGRVLKIETMSISGERYTHWFETFTVRPLTADLKNFDDRDEADFLQEEGQLKHDLAIEVEDMKEFGQNANDVILKFTETGTVHHPYLFEAAVKGYNIDTTDFVINTADNVRFREGHHDQ